MFNNKRSAVMIFKDNIGSELTIKGVMLEVDKFGYLSVHKQQLKVAGSQL